jgi:protease IV
MTTADIERIFDRERIRKSRKRWRIFGILALLALIGSLVWQFRGEAPRGDHIARLRIDGMITGDEPTLDLVRRIAEAKNVKGLIIRIDSPGGTTSGSEALYEEIRKVAKDKPVAAVMDTVAASGGYITAIAADHIVARGNTITGSIGVIFTFPEVSKLLDTLGVKFEEIKSGDLKAEPTPYKPISEKARQVSTLMVQDAFDWFIGLVAERRKMTETRARFLADGRVYTGRQALKEGLIDKIGGEEEAIAWLETEKKLAKDLDVVDWANRPSLDPTGLGFAAGDQILSILGLKPLKTVADRAKLDGLLVLWHPQL